ncbi:glycosyltransferase family 4 protein [Alkalihalobacillus sp. AL-G]|uniref:glycosyltransferase family 4 protein n=1 Tax=Alkalihalobacillus sp. AL-G TaxID=2926399 RepID=UPI00272CE0E0|nr:glycosyltransferase family 4 protein [Alkalihalobacillus sp. AL-G]WLD93005.1 glycosyltransferase family 4 protein [Alkalihalobacillus sp. AL-G]
MKILQITAVDFTLKKFLLPLIDELENKGYNVDIACNIHGIGNQLIKDGYNIINIPFTRDMNIINHLKCLIKLIKLIKAGEYDIIHTHTPVASLIGRFAAKVAGSKTIVYTAHGFYFHENMNPLIYKTIYFLEKTWAKYFSDYIFFQSCEDYDLAIKKKFKPKNRLIHIGNGVSSEKFNPTLYDGDKIRQELGLQKEDIVITFIGRMVIEKGIVELLQAFRSIKNKGFKQIKLLLIGGQVEGDRDSFDLNQYVSNLNKKISKDIHVLGLRDDIPLLLSSSDIFVLPSYREGLPRSIIEAMGMAKPIIATNIRGCREEVFPNVNGYLCNVKDSHDLGEKILKLINNKELISKFGEASRDIFLNHFDERKVINKQIDVFNSL